MPSRWLLLPHDDETHLPYSRPANWNCAFRFAHGLSPHSFAAEAGAIASTPTGAAVERVAKIQTALKDAGIDGWLFYDFRASTRSPIASSSCPAPVSRRDGGSISSGLGRRENRARHRTAPPRSSARRKTVYSAWPTLQDAIRTALAGKKKLRWILPDGGIPYLALSMPARWILCGALARQS